jgi:hypothetical protein
MRLIVQEDFSKLISPERFESYTFSNDKFTETQKYMCNLYLKGNAKWLGGDVLKNYE